MISDHIFDIIKKYFKISEDNSCLEFKSISEDQYIKKVVRILYYEDVWFVECGIAKKYRLLNETVYGKADNCIKVIDNSIFSYVVSEGLVNVGSTGDMIKFLVDEVIRYRNL